MDEKLTPNQDIWAELGFDEIDFSNLDQMLDELGMDRKGNERPRTDKNSAPKKKKDSGAKSGKKETKPEAEKKAEKKNTQKVKKQTADKSEEQAAEKTETRNSENLKKKKVKKQPKAEKEEPSGDEKNVEKSSGGPSVIGVIAGTFVKTVAVVLCIVLTVSLLGNMVLMVGTASGSASGGSSSVTILDKYDMFITNEISNALDGILAVEKVYWLSDSDLVAPEPKAENYGSVSSPAELMWLLDEAAELIGDQEMIFDENTPAWSGEPIRYYYDETILVITWKQLIDRVMYTLSEVKIAHPSQFRRFLAGGEFGSDKQYITTDMASSVNAVVASSGDFYKYRRNGAVVYEGQLRRFEGMKVDTCFINDQGDLLFAYRGDLTTEAQAKQFVEENGVRFSLAFGPILVDNGEACPPKSYLLGEINDVYARAAICQKDKLHYLMASACGEDNTGYQNRHDIPTFARTLESFGVEKAYALDGGQTTVIAMNGQMINDVEFGYQRAISDIIYFATAMPNGG